MCCVNSDNAKYEVIVKTLENDVICSVNFKSISTVCRFLDEVNFKICDVDIIRIDDQMIFDRNILMDIWRVYETD